jgi:UDP:flavonoid glycosyltransferase YjiC (YdhE family)
LPQAADQFLNASAGARARVAREIPAGEITAERVRQELERVLHDPAIAAASRAMSAEIAAMPSAGDVADELARRYGTVDRR